MTEINQNEIKIITSSNDVGVVFHWKNRIFRAIQKEHVDLINYLFESGMIK